MLRRASVQLLEWLAILLLLLQVSECKKCVKRPVIAHRENNGYECNHPVYSECCERGDRFTCCEPTLSRNLREQLQLWGFVGVMVAVGAGVYACLVRDNELIRSDTLREAATNLGRRLGIRRATGQQQATGTGSTSDRTAIAAKVEDSASYNPYKSFYDV